MAGKKKILVIEDSNLVSSILEAQLRENGFEVVISHDGAEGLKKIKETKPNLIILDLVLPGLPGEQVCKAIRSDEETKGISIIMLTAKNTDTDRIIGRVIGADTYLPKPFEMEKLLKEIDRLIAG